MKKLDRYGLDPETDYEEDGETVKDGRVVRVPMMMCDSLQRRVMMDAAVDRAWRHAAAAAGLDGVSYAEARALCDEARLAGAKADEVAWMRDRVTRHRVTRDPRGRLISTSEEIETDDLNDAAAIVRVDSETHDATSAMDAKERAWLEGVTSDENAWRKPLR
jgi:hypothetical protein